MIVSVGLMVIFAMPQHRLVWARAASAFGYVSYIYGVIVTWHYSTNFYDVDREGPVGFMGILLMIVFPLIAGVAVALVHKFFESLSNLAA